MKSARVASGPASCARMVMALLGPVGALCAGVEPPPRRGTWGWSRKKMTSLIGGRIASIALAAMLTSCDSHHSNPQLQWGWIANCEGSEFGKLGHPGPERPVFRITDQLVVAVPKTNRPNGGSIDREPRECRHISDLPSADHLEFVIQGDWSAGYDVADIPTVAGGLKDFRPDSVWVRVERERPSKFSPEEQQKIDQLLKDGQRRHYDETREIGGLTCLMSTQWYFATHPQCSGHRSPGDADLTKVSLKLHTPNTHFILIQADYTSSRYGGIHVYWQAWTSEVSHWRDIDTEIFNSLAHWNLVNTTESSTGR